MQTIRRPAASARVRALLADFPAVALLGPRQCGKTSLARSLLPRRGALYLDLERPRDAERLRDADLFLGQHRGELVCLDEVQRMPALFPLLRSLIDDDPRPGRFLLLGSASPDLIRYGSESLAGRLAVHELTPFTVVEAVPRAADVLTHWRRGGFPRSLLARDDASSFEWREAFVRSFLERDLALLGVRTEPAAMDRFWRMIAHHHAQVLNLSALGGSLGVTHPTVRARVDAMAGAFMLRVLPPLEANLGKRLVKSPKVYLRDSGLLHALLDIATGDDLFAHPSYGASWEGYVIEQAITAAAGYRASFYRTSDGTEIDLVLEKGRRRIAIECKASSAPQVSKGFWNALDDLRIEEACVVAPVEHAWPLEKRVRVIAPTGLRGLFD
jgi:predicted AAA+ superfamily ATPase